MHEYEIVFIARRGGAGKFSDLLRHMQKKLYKNMGLQERRFPPAPPLLLFLNELNVFKF